MLAVGILIAFPVSFIPDAEAAEYWRAVCDRVAHQDPSFVSDQSEDNNYAFFRTIERRLLQHWSIASLDRGSAPGGACKLWKIVTAPRDYRWAMRNRSSLEKAIKTVFHAETPLPVPEGEDGVCATAERT